MDLAENNEDFVTMVGDMKKLHGQTSGFTTIELLVFVLVLGIIGVVALTNVRTVRAQDRDRTSKTDINAVYYQLESFREKNGYYPEKIDTATLKGMDPENLKDRFGLAPNDEKGRYTYKPAGCTEAKCTSFRLTAQLEKEAPFIKESLSK